METKARYIFVGFCSLLGIALAMGTLVFSLQRGDTSRLAYYAIDFTGSVAGLSIGNDVRFNGIKIGVVRNFTINQNDPSQVRVIIEVDADTPVRENSEASLSLQGITGLAVIDITGGTADSPKLPRGTADNTPVIKSRRSTLDSMLAEAPTLIYQANELLRRSSNMLSPENQESMSSILKSLARVGDMLEQQSDNMNIIMENMAQASIRLNKVLIAADQVIGQDLAAGVANFSRTFERLESFVAEIEPGAKRLTGGATDELIQTLNEAQVLFNNLNILVNSLNNDPQRLIFGDSIQGIRVK